MGAVLDHNQIMPGCNIHDGIHIRHLGSKMDHNNCTGFLSDSRFDGLGVDAIRIRRDIHNHGYCSGCHRCRRSGLESIGRHNDFIPPANTSGSESHLHRNGAVHHRNSEPTTLHLRKFLCERGCIGSRVREPPPASGFDGVCDSGKVPIIKYWPGWVGCFPNRVTT